MIIGYARVSTREQIAGYDAQIVELTNAGCTKIFKEKVSAVKQRDQLEAALEFAREDDSLVVCKLDRLARSISDLCRIVESLDKKRVALKVLNINLDTSSPTGKLMLNLLGSIFEFERSMMLERQRDGIFAAKQAGKYRGRSPTARSKSEEVLALAAQRMTRQKIADELNIGIASVYRILAQHKAATPSVAAG